MSRKKNKSRSKTKPPVKRTVPNQTRVEALKAKVVELMRLATEHHQHGKFMEAMGLYRKILKIQPTNSIALNNLGLIRKNLGEPRVAEEIIRMAVNLQPNNPDYHFNLGNTLKDDNRFLGAVAEYNIALKLKPDYFKALLNAGDTLRILGNYEGAQKAFTKAMVLRPKNKDVKLNQANLLLEMGKGDEAASIYEVLIKLTPRDARLYSNCGTAYKQVGKLKEAAEYYRKAVDINPNMISAMFSAVNLEKAKPGDPWFEILTKLKQNPRVALHDKIGLCFALGKMHHDVGEYDEAFVNYREGNVLRDQQALRLNRKFDRNMFKKQTDDIIKSYSPEQFKKIRQVGALGDNEYTPIFVVGMPRSGTTLTEQILATHPKGDGAGELTDISDLSRIIDNRNIDDPLPYPQNIECLTEERAIELASRYLARINELCPGSARVVDKMPGNFSYLGFIAHLFPAAKIIDCRRDPIDNCLSCYMQNFSRRHEYSNDLGHLAFAYNEYLRIMQYWNENLPIKIYRLQYEDLVENHEESVRKLLDFCGLEWNDAVLQFYKTQRNVQTASVVQVRQPLYKSAINRWKHYEKHLKPLIAGLDLQAHDDAVANT
jgi:tetratricopeptide (TPR) repeat protein